MTEEQRYHAVQTDIERLMQQATNDQSPGGVVGFGAALLAAKLYSINEQGNEQGCKKELPDGKKDTDI